MAKLTLTDSLADQIIDLGRDALDNPNASLADCIKECYRLAWETWNPIDAAMASGERLETVIDPLTTTHLADHQYRVSCVLPASVAKALRDDLASWVGGNQLTLGDAVAQLAWSRYRQIVADTAEPYVDGIFVAQKALHLGFMAYPV
ncbi:MAG: hypothetical protein HQL58_12090 [Magnetococcales bacterium]|nr:hypothetical protein [Magnetococcales bacterium]